MTEWARHGSLLLIVMLTGIAECLECGQEELVRCARPLQVLSDTSELSFVETKEELSKMCPDLLAGLRCIHSYTRRCMTLRERTHFGHLYAGTNTVIKELCEPGPYQDEFLSHASCMKTVKREYETCAKTYQSTISNIGRARPGVNVTSTAAEQHEEHVRTICCSFQEYMECSEQNVQRACGNKTAAFTRNFLDRMASNLIKMHCSEYQGTQCGLSAGAGMREPSSGALALLAAAAALWLLQPGLQVQSCRRGRGLQRA